MPLTKYFHQMVARSLSNPVPLVEEIAHFPAKEESTGASPVGHTNEDNLTILEKLRIMRQSVGMTFDCSNFEEFRTLSGEPKIEMVPHGMWEAHVTFYLHRQSGVFRQDATFANADFESLVEQVWKAYQEVYQGVVE